MTSVCILCGSNKAAPLYPGILKCIQCALVYADLELKDEDVRELYRRDYFFGEEYNDYLADRGIIERNFRLRLNVLSQFIQPDRHKRLLEVGCAYGFFLALARDRFESVLGIDISDDGIRYCREILGLDVIRSDLQNIDLGEQEFDVVCLWDTIEHLLKPHLYLEKISRHTRPGGLIALTTGDIESLNARLMKKNWRLIHPPTHVYYFSLDTLRRLLWRYGFEIIYHKHCGLYRSLDLALYQLLVLRSGKEWIYRKLNSLGVGRTPFYLNLYDILYVIGRKIDVTYPSHQIS